MKHARKFVKCLANVNKKAVSTRNIGGIEHLIIDSHTLPFNIVMNGGLYSEEEIKKSYKSLDKLLAPIEHPTDEEGRHVSAFDPIAIANNHVGAFVTNPRIEGNRIRHDIAINPKLASNSDKGKRLLDRINEIKTSDAPRPIHTSVGVWLEVEPLKTPMTNAEGQEYSWIAKNMTFDHQAILLDSIGAAQPHQGVGMAVNEEGMQVEVEMIDLDEMMTVTPEEVAAPTEPVSAANLTEQLTNDIKATTAATEVRVVDIIGDLVVFETQGGLFSVPFVLDANSGQARIVGLPIRVDKVVTYKPKTNSNEGDVMKEMILNALAKAGVEVKDLTDEQLLAKYDELHANQSKSDESGANADDLAKIVANAVAPLTAKIGELEGKLNAKQDSEKGEAISVVVNSGKFPGLDAETAKLLPMEKLKEMAANCTPAFGLPITSANNSQRPEGYAPLTMPK